MILADVTVLVYAFRVDSKDHARYKTWLEDVINGPSGYGVSQQVLASVVRICGQPNARIVIPGDRHWSIFGKLRLDAKSTGNLVKDAWNAALAIEAGGEWITTDRDYARFQGFNWRSPF